MRPTRIEALADGIFAIVMTLLVLELKVPEVARGVFHNDDLLYALFDLWPNLLAYCLSFFILSMYWLSHHVLFTYVDKADFSFIWRNILFLLIIGLIPFSTALLGHDPFTQLPQLVYAVNLIIPGLLIYGMWRYIMSHEHMVSSDRTFSDELLRNVRGKILIPPMLYMIGVVVSFFSTRWSLAFFAIGPLIYFIDIDHPLWQIVAAPFAPKKK